MLCCGLNSLKKLDLTIQSFQPNLTKTENQPAQHLTFSQLHPLPN